MMVLVVDNYDSFTYNLVQYLGELGATVRVVRNDKVDADTIAHLNPDAIVISPGPGTPNEAGSSMELIAKYAEKLPTLGVCLGHQCIGQVFAAEVTRAPRLMHGKTSMIRHDGKGLFANLPNPFQATRYHSLIVKPEHLSPDVVVCAWSVDDDLVMGLRHKRFPLHGVQFHPESILTPDGKQLLRNFLDLAAATRPMAQTS